MTFGNWLLCAVGTSFCMVAPALTASFFALGDCVIRVSDLSWISTLAFRVCGPPASCYSIVTLFHRCVNIVQTAIFGVKQNRQNPPIATRDKPPDPGLARARRDNLFEIRATRYETRLRSRRSMLVVTSATGLSGVARLYADFRASAPEHFDYGCDARIARMPAVVRSQYPVALAV